MKRLLILAAMLVAACQPIPVDGGSFDVAERTQRSPAVSDVGSLSAAECAARGGKMLPQGRMQTVRCVIRYADADKRCTDGDDCLGGCRIPGNGAVPREGTAAVGRCQADSSNFGCYTTVENGRAEPTLCVD